MRLVDFCKVQEVDAGTSLAWRTVRSSGGRECHVKHIHLALHTYHGLYDPCIERGIISGNGSCGFDGVLRLPRRQVTTIGDFFDRADNEAVGMSVAMSQAQAADMVADACLLVGDIGMKGAVAVMHPEAFHEIGRIITEPYGAMKTGEPGSHMNTLAGVPVVLSYEMPGMAPGNDVALIGAFYDGYVVGVNYTHRDAEHMIGGAPVDCGAFHIVKMGGE